MAKPKKTPLERLNHGLSEMSRSFGRLAGELGHPEQKERTPGPRWRWMELPGGGAALLGERGEVLVKAEWMPKPYVAEAIATAPDLRKEKFGILFDRRFLTTQGPEQLEWAEGTTHALLFLDLDGMKTINDRLGHDAGDEILQTYFASVVFVLHRIGEAYCWGGDEVVVLLPDHNQARAEAVRDEIVATVTKKCSLHPRIHAEGIAVGLSIGVHVFDENAESLIEVVKRADAEMYKIKNLRRAARSTPAA